MLNNLSKKLNMIQPRRIAKQIEIRCKCSKNVFNGASAAFSSSGRKVHRTKMSLHRNKLLTLQPGRDRRIRARPWFAPQFVSSAEHKHNKA